MSKRSARDMWEGLTNDPIGDSMLDDGEERWVMGDARH